MLKKIKEILSDFKSILEVIFWVCGSISLGSWGIVKFYDDITKFQLTILFLAFVIVILFLISYTFIKFYKRQIELSETFHAYSDKNQCNLISLEVRASDENDKLSFREFIKYGKLQGVADILNNIQTLVNIITFTKPRDVKVKCYLFSNDVIKAKNEESFNCSLSDISYYCFCMDNLSFSTSKDELLKLKNTAEWSGEKIDSIRKIKIKFIKDTKENESFFIVPMSIEYSETLFVLGFITVRFVRGVKFRNLINKYILAMTCDLSYYIDRLRVISLTQYGIANNFFEIVYKHLKSGGKSNESKNL